MNRWQARRVRYAVREGKWFVWMQRQGIAIRGTLELVESGMRKQDRALLREVMRRERLR